MKIFENVTIVIVSYRSKKKIQNIIGKLSDFKIIIIDNSLDYLLEKEIKNHKNIAIYLKDNIGYGGAVNFARKKISSKYFLLCNPDLENIDNNSIKNFYDIAEDLFPNFLSLGPIFDKKDKNINLNYIKKDKISGACMFFNSASFDKINGFDENIFLYFEEDDLCKRGNKKKLFSYQLNNLYIEHQIGTSVSNIDINEKNKIKELTWWHFIWSKYYFYQKHYGKLISIILFLPTLLRILFKLSYTKVRKDNVNYTKYRVRLSGLISSMIGKKSYKRINLNNL